MKSFTIIKILEIEVEADSEEEALDIANYDKSLNDYEEKETYIELNCDYEHPTRKVYPNQRRVK